MNGFPKKEIVERIKTQYPAGTKVELVRMSDPQAPAPGTTGVVTGVDDIGTIHIAWSTGSGLGAAYGEDVVRKITED